MTGISQFHGTTAGPMSAVVHDGLAKLSPADQQAVTRYIASLGDGDTRAAPAIARAMVSDRVGLTYNNDARLFTGACASCHHNSGIAPNPLRPDIALNSAVNLDEPTNLIRVILYGIDARQGTPGIVMPGFIGFGDDVARLAAYVRRTRTSSVPKWASMSAPHWHASSPKNSKQIGIRFATSSNTAG